MTAQMGVSLNDDHADDTDRERPRHRDGNWLADWADGLLRLLGLRPKPAGKPGHRKGGDQS